MKVAYNSHVYRHSIALTPFRVSLNYGWSRHYELTGLVEYWKKDYLNIIMVF